MDNNNRSEILDTIQKKQEHEKDNQQQNQGFQQQQQHTKPGEKPLHGKDTQDGSAVTQHIPAQQLLTSSNNLTQQSQPKDESKDKTIKVTNSTTITLIENSNNTSEKEKDSSYKNYFTLEPKNDKKDDCNKNSITITRTVPKQSPGGAQGDKAKVGQKTVNKRPLQCLETLAEKAGITFEDKYEVANTLLALDKPNNSFRRNPELKQPKVEPENISQQDEYRYRNHKEEDDKLQIQQQIIQQQQQQQQQQHLQQLQQQQFQQLQQHQIQFQQQQLQRQHQQAIQQHIKNQHDQQELLQKQFQQQQQHPQQQQQQHSQQKTEQVNSQQELQQQKFLQVVNNQPVHTQQFNVPGIGEINLSFLSSPQNTVNVLNQKTGMSSDIKPPQQLVDSQNQQITMSQHEANQQHHQTVTVVSSMPNSMAQHQVQQQQNAGGIQQQAAMPPMQSMPPNSQHPQQISAEWGHSRVQVIQQPLQNSAYLPQLYNAQGGLLVPGNIALHPAINSHQIQVIAAGKPFQGNQLAPHMLTAQGKQVIQGQTAPFPGYTTIPTIPTTQNQTFVFSPLGVINSQPSILPTQNQPTVSNMQHQQKPNEMHKVIPGNKVSTNKVAPSSNNQHNSSVQTQCVQVSQPVLSAQPPQQQIISPLQAGGQTMQFAPWQISGALPQVWTGGLQTGSLPAGGLIAPNPIFIRGTQPDASSSMFIQHSPQNNVQHNSGNNACAPGGQNKPRPEAGKLGRPLSAILPAASAGVRPASSVSTQTGTTQHQVKQRGKPGVRSPAPAAKQDAANQTNKMQQPLKQQLVVMNAGQMTQLASMDGKQLSKQQQQQAAMMQQQHMLQQTQVLQQFQQPGMTLGMQQGTIPMAGMPQTISMVQQIQPLGGMGQPGTLVGHINTSQQAQNNSLAQVQTMQQQAQALVGNNLVQTSVGMAVQQQANMNQSTQMQSATNADLPDLIAEFVDAGSRNRVSDSVRLKGPIDYQSN